MASSPNIPENEENLLDGSPLCLQCGLCCQGALHHYGSLSEDEVEKAIQTGLVIEREPDYLAFALPCSKVEGTRCTIYEQRPITCVGYRCGLLKRYQKGEIPIDNALSLVAEAHRLFQSAISAVPRGLSFRDVRWKLRKHMRREPEGDLTSADREGLKGAFLKATLLDVFLDRHFRLKRELTFMGPDEAESKETPPAP